MSSELFKVEFALDDTIGGRRLTPETVDLPTPIPPQTDELDERALALLWENGKMAWHGIQSAAEWVEALRGNS